MNQLDDFSSLSIVNCMNLSHIQWECSLFHLNNYEIKTFHEDGQCVKNLPSWCKWEDLNMLLDMDPKVCSRTINILKLIVINRVMIVIRSMLELLAQPTLFFNHWWSYFNDLKWSFYLSHYTHRWHFCIESSIYSIHVQSIVFTQNFLYF